MNRPQTPSDSKEQTREQQFAQAFAATANHAVSCITTDIASPIIDRELQKRGMSWKGIKIFGIPFFAGCGHDHSVSADCGHDHSASSPKTHVCEPGDACQTGMSYVPAQEARESRTAEALPVAKSIPTAESSANSPAPVKAEGKSYKLTLGPRIPSRKAPEAAGPLPGVQTVSIKTAPETLTELLDRAPKNTNVTGRSFVAEAVVAEAVKAEKALCPYHALSLPKMYAAHFGSDILAVPLALGVQRLVPGVNRTIRTLVSPLDSTYRKRAHRTAVDWAQQNGVSADAKETKDYEKRVFDYEIGQALPNGIVWGALSLGLDPLIQRYVFNSRVTPETMLISGLSGAVSSSLLVFEARLHAPGLMQKFDQFNGDHLVTPVTRLAGQAAGINTREIEKAVKAGDEPDGKWAKRAVANENNRAERVA